MGSIDNEKFLDVPRRPDEATAWSWAIVLSAGVKALILPARPARRYAPILHQSALASSTAIVRHIAFPAPSPPLLVDRGRTPGRTGHEQQSV
jgi:hypothetical protein